MLEVRTDSREAVPGIVHDVSNTGATLFVEPFRAVDPCNHWRETAAEAQREEERVLRRLSHLLGEQEELATTAIEAAADLDLITARARLGRLRLLNTDAQSSFQQSVPASKCRNSSVTISTSVIMRRSSAMA